MSTETNAVHPSLEWFFANISEGPKEVVVATAEGVLASYKVVKKFFGYQASYRLRAATQWMTIPPTRSLFSAKGYCQITEHQANGWPTPTRDAVLDTEPVLASA